MDAFYASVEQRDNKAYQGKPLAVGGGSQRGVVAAASYEARKFGVRSAMPGKQALQKCPDLIFVKPRFTHYKNISQQIREIFLEYTHLMEPLSLDEAYLDVTRPLKGKNSATLIAHEIRKRIFQETGLTASAGISCNKFLAKIASDINKPNGYYVIRPEEASVFIEKLPIGEFFGVGKVTAQKFQKLGIHNGMDLRNASRALLMKYFGKNGLFFYDIARGIDRRKVEHDRVRKSVGAENTFHKDLLSEAELNKAMEEICDTLYLRLHKAGVWGKTLTIKIKYHDFEQITRSRSFSEGIHNRDSMWHLACTMLHANRHPGKPIRLLGISFSQLEAAENRPGRQLRLNLKNY